MRPVTISHVDVLDICDNAYSEPQQSKFCLLSAKQADHLLARSMTWRRHRPEAWSKGDLGALAFRGAPDLGPISSRGAMEAALSGMRVSGGMTYSPWTSYLHQHNVCHCVLKAHAAI